MSFLLDTQVLLWLSSNHPSLPGDVKEMIRTSTEPCFVSIVSAWEIAIKAGLGKLELDLTIDELLGPELGHHGISLLPLELGDISDYKNLPFPDSNHRDPFDRMLMVQAQRRSLQLVSADTSFDQYQVTRLWK